MATPKLGGLANINDFSGMTRVFVVSAISLIAVDGGTWCF